MSLLVIDAGNARLKWALLERGATQRFTDRGVAEFGGDVRAVVSAVAAVLTPQISTVVIGNVAGAELGAKLAEMLQRSGSAAVWFAQTTAHAGGVRNGYSQPQSLGVDRWAAIIAAFQRVRASAPGKPVCVVDAGTALTIDAVSPAGVHCGGLILPGLGLQARALYDATADIRVPAAPAANHRDSMNVFGLDVFARSTAQALANSGVLACAAAVDRCARTLRPLGDPVVLLCGGDAERLAPWLETSAEICPNLVFEGLVSLFEQRTWD